jgi:hypothetical protein
MSYGGQIQPEPRIGLISRVILKAGFLDAFAGFLS